MRTLRFSVPANLDIDDLISRNPHAFYGKKKLCRAKLLYIISTIVKCRQVQRKRMEEKETPFAEVSSRSLDAVVHNYSDYIRFLFEEGIISCNGEYKVGKTCYGYRFNPPYCGQQLKIVELENYRLSKSIREQKEKNKPKQRKLQKEYPYLTKWWDQPGLTIDKEKAFEWIDSYQQERITAILEDSSIEDVKPLIDNIVDTCEDFKGQVTSIYMGDFRYGFSGVGHRFYTRITNLKKELRQFITYNGQPLVELDKKNSQPYLSLALLKRSFYRYHDKQSDDLSLRALFRNLDRKPEILANVGGEGRGCSLSAIIMLLETVETYAEQGFHGFWKYRDYVKGDFYLEMEKLFKPVYPDRFDCRGNVKKEILRIFYMNPKMDSADYYAPAQTFKDHFEFVYNLFSIIKAKDHADLANILQRIESYLFLDVICRKIYELDPEIPLFTIHDCILTTQGNEDLVRSVIEEELLKYIGAPATLTCELVTQTQCL